MTPFEASHRSQIWGLYRLNVPRGPETEDDTCLLGTIVTDIIEERPGAAKFERPETRREGTEA